LNSGSIVTSTRRAFLKQTVGFSAALALGSAGRMTFADARTSDEAACHLLAIGDYGAKTGDLPRQRAVSRGMAKYLSERHIRPDGLLMLGDNFYGGLGGKGVRSPRWGVNVERMYPADVFDCPMYAVLGNHDYSGEHDRGSVNAQLAYGRLPSRPRWTLPHKWYRFDVFGRGRGRDGDRNRERPLASVLVVDTNYVYGHSHWVTKDERARQARWLAEELAKPRVAPWLFVLGHHPVYSDGHHGDSKPLIADLDPLFRRHKVDLYLSGHDHDLQHLEFANHPTSFVVSGGGGARARPIKSRPREQFGMAVYGFTHLELTRDRLRLRHLDANGVGLHTFTKSLEGGVSVMSGDAGDGIRSRTV
jgi:tartrate-resistant acid phosphatase type 5